jgi:pyruvate-formate lyase
MSTAASPDGRKAGEPLSQPEFIPLAFGKKALDAMESALTGA